MTEVLGDPSEFGDDKNFDLNVEPDEPHAFVQYKGTDICMDFHCECGAQCHFDGDFAYVVQCPHCKAKWEMPPILYPRRAVAGKTYEYWLDNPKELEPDDDFAPPTV